MGKSMNNHFTKEEIHGKQAHEKCSASSVISEMQMEVIKRCHYTPIRMPQTNKQNDSSTKCRKRGRETRSLINVWITHILLIEVESGTTTPENNLAVPHKTNHSIII